MKIWLVTLQIVLLAALCSAAAVGTGSKSAANRPIPPTTSLSRKVTRRPASPLPPPAPRPNLHPPQPLPPVSTVSPCKTVYPNNTVVNGTPCTGLLACVNRQQPEKPNVPVKYFCGVQLPSILTRPTPTPCRLVNRATNTVVSNTGCSENMSCSQQVKINATTTAYYCARNASLPPRRPSVAVNAATNKPATVPAVRNKKD